MICCLFVVWPNFGSALAVRQMAPHLSLKYFDNTEEFEVDCCRASLDSNPNHPFITMFGSLAVRSCNAQRNWKKPRRTASCHREFTWMSTPRKIGNCCECLWLVNNVSQCRIMELGLFQHGSSLIDGQQQLLFTQWCKPPTAKASAFTVVLTLADDQLMKCNWLAASSHALDGGDYPLNSHTAIRV